MPLHLITMLHVQYMHSLHHRLSIDPCSLYWLFKNIIHAPVYLKQNVAFLYAIISYWFKIADLTILKFSLCDMCIWWHTTIFVWKSIFEDVNVMHLIFLIMICVHLQGFFRTLCSKSIKQLKYSMLCKIVYMRILILFSQSLTRSSINSYFLLNNNY